MIHQKEFINNIHYRGYDFLFNRNTKAAVLELNKEQNEPSEMIIHCMAEFFKEDNEERILEIFKYFIEFKIAGNTIKMDMFKIDKLFSKYLDKDTEILDELFFKNTFDDVDYEDELVSYWKIIFYYLYMKELFYNNELNDKYKDDFLYKEFISKENNLKLIQELHESLQ